MTATPIAVSEELDRAYEAYKLNPALEDAFFKQLYKFVHNHRMSTKDDDETQEAVLRIWQKLSKFDGKSKFSTWAFQVTQRSLKTEKRKGLLKASRESSLDTLLDEGKESLLGESPIMSPETAKLVDEALEALTDRQREIVGLMREGYTEQQAGDLLGISHQAVHVHWETALKRLSEG